MVSLANCSLPFWTVAVTLVCAQAASLSASPPLSIQRGTRRVVEVYREIHTKGPDDDDSDDSTPDTAYRCTVYGTTTTPEYPWCPEGGDSGRCTVRGTTDTPIYPWCPEGVGEESDDATDDYAPDGDIGDDEYDYDGSKDCAAIAEGTASTDEWEYSRYQIDLALEIDGDVAETLARLETFLQEYIATDLAGCNDGKDRGVDIQNVLFDVVEDKKSEPYCESCTNADVSADIYYDKDADDSMVEGAVLDAFLDRCDEMKTIEGIVDTYDPCPTIQVSPVAPEDEGDKDGVVTSPPLIDDGGVDIPDSDRDGSPVVEESQSSPEDDHIAAAGIFGIVLAFLVLMALLSLLLSRRRRNARRRLAKGLNETYDMDAGNGPARFMDDDSMMDSRNGMYPEGKTENMVLGIRDIHHDVHKCASATCNLCEARRRNGLFFLPASGPVGQRPPVMVPDSNPMAEEAPRSYGVDDTVEL